MSEENRMEDMERAEELREGAEETRGAEEEPEKEAAGAGETADGAGSEEDSGSDGGAEADEELNVKYMRLMADFQNFRRRTEEEKSRIYAYANEKLAGDLLSVLDNFERALSAEGASEAYAKGMDMIFTQLKDALKKSGVEEIEAEGKIFDPNFHQAVLTEDTDEVESGCVSAVMQKGYTLNGKVIRPSMVKVAN